jgi:hypothetical protein
VLFVLASGDRNCETGGDSHLGFSGSLQSEFEI